MIIHRQCGCVAPPISLWHIRHHFSCLMWVGRTSDTLAKAMWWLSMKSKRGFSSANKSVYCWRCTRCRSSHMNSSHLTNPSRLRVPPYVGTSLRFLAQVTESHDLNRPSHMTQGDYITKWWGSHNMLSLITWHNNYSPKSPLQVSTATDLHTDTRGVDVSY